MSLDRKALPELRPSVAAQNNTKDIAQARANATFPVETLANYIYKGEARRRWRDGILKIVEKEPLFNKSMR
jgi:hypothetical protein